MNANAEGDRSVKAGSQTRDVLVRKYPHSELFLRTGLEWMSLAERKPYLIYRLISIYIPYIDLGSYIWPVT